MVVPVARHIFSVFDVTRQVFFESASSLGIVNLKPLRPGHVLIISKRNVPRLADLEPREVSDLFQSVQRVGSVLEKAFKAEALNVAVQDGVAAGQSVPHVHVHIIPRLASDFGGVTDNVYPALEQSERDLAADLRDSGLHVAREAVAGAAGLASSQTAVAAGAAVGHAAAVERAHAAAKSRAHPHVGDVRVHAAAVAAGMEPATASAPVTPRRVASPVPGASAGRDPRGWQVPKDEERVPRTMEEMEAEAQWLRELLREAGVE